MISLLKLREIKKKKLAQGHQSQYANVNLKGGYFKVKPKVRRYNKLENRCRNKFLESFGQKENNIIHLAKVTNRVSFQRF